MRPLSRLFLSLTTALVCCYPTLAIALDGATVTLSPTGEAKVVRQVRAHFTESMLPFGDPRTVVSPFDISCTAGAKGKERWADAENWIFDFVQDLPAGESCTFTVKPDLKTLKGGSIIGEHKFTFTTGGVAIKQTIPYSEIINEDQVFIFVLDGEPETASVVQNAYFEVPGHKDRIGVRVIEGADREQYIKVGYYRESDSPLIVLQAKQKFPAASRVEFTWGAGIKTKSGVARSDDQTLEFTAREKFNARLNCERTTASDPCIPLSNIALTFSAPVAWDKVSGATIVDASGGVWKAVAESDSDDGESPTLDKGDRFVSSLSFAAPFPENTKLKVNLPPGISDDSGRLLSNAGKFPLQFKTALNPPLAKFAASFGIIESNDAPALPVTLRYVEPNVITKVMPLSTAEPGRELPALKARIARVGDETEVMRWISRVEGANGYWYQQKDQAGKVTDTREKSVFNDPLFPYALAETTINKPGLVKDAEVVGLPLDGPGFYVVEIESPALGRTLIGNGKKMYVSSSALVTNLAVHFKSGRDSSMVWVTTLDSAQPVAGAEVVLTTCSGQKLWSGTTAEDGVANITDVPRVSKLPSCTGYPAALMISAKKGSDFSFTLSSWNEGIEPWRFGMPYAWYSDSPLFAHTVLARNLVKPNETVHMKHFLRKRTLRVLEQVPSADRLDTLEIIHSESRQRYRFPVTWTENGEAETTWTVPKDAKLGSYNLFLAQAKDLKQPTDNTTGTGYEGEESEEDYSYNSNSKSLSAGSFRIAEYRVPLMRGYIQSPVDHLVRPENVTLNMGATYLSSGGASKLPVRLRYDVKPHGVPTPDGFEGYTFSNGQVKEQVTRSGSFRDERESSTPKDTVKKLDLILDSQGAGQVVVRDLPPLEAPSEIQAELEYRDPVGEIQTVSSVIPLWPAERLVGVKTEYWALIDKDFEFKIAVTDLKGNPVSDAAARVTLYSRESYSHRKRLVGGFYGYENISETKKKGVACEGRTNSSGVLLCQIKSAETGSLILQAETADSAGRVSYANAAVWVRDPKGLWFEPEDNDRIDLIPEKRFYEPGDIARFQVRMPFRKATALVTLEREGVAEHFVKEVSSESPVIEFPVLDTYTPNMYVSALLVRGRIADQALTALLDLGKPAYKLGVSEIKVGWKKHELTVSAKTDKDVYRVREKAKLSVHVARADGSKLPAGSQVAIAAVDEGLLELMANTTWDLLSAMMGRRDYLVETFTAQMQVIGKRHFGVKSAPHGGGGGSGKQARELFDTLLAWYPSVALDSEGNASIEVPLNDSLTSFRLVAIAHGDIGAFGKGETTVRTTQDLMVFAGVAPIAREDDNFAAEFTLRNTTAAPKTVEFSGLVRETGVALSAQTIVLAASESKVLRWNVLVPFDKSAELTFAMEAKEGSAVLDRLEAKQRILPAVPTRVIQATLLQVDGSKTMPVKRPADSIPGRGGIRVNLAPTIVGSLEGVYAYMRLYPYSCLEQRVSRAIALGDEDLWNGIVASLPTYMDSEGLLKFFPSMTLGSATLTSYVLAISNEAGYAIPDETRERLLTGISQVFSGNIERDLTYISPGNKTLLRIMILEALSRFGRATPDMLSTIKREESLWPTSTLIDWMNALRRMAAFPDQQAMVSQTEQILRSKLNFQGTVMGFSQEDSLWWFLRSVDHDAVRMILATLPVEGWQGDLPRMMRGAIERQRRGAWDLTTANAWGTLTVKAFVAKFERESVTGKSSGALGSESKSYVWEEPVRAGSIMLSWPGADQLDLKMSHEGTGAPWAFVQSLAAIPLKEPLSTGYSVKRTVTPIDQKRSGVWSQGDIYRVKLEVEAQADRTWVVVLDPIPAGATILGTGLGRDSALLTQGEDQRSDWWSWPAFEERAQDSFRAYYEYVPKGSFSTAYTVRLNSSGHFKLPPTRVEAMYSPEMFGEIPNSDFVVE